MVQGLGNLTVYYKITVTFFFYVFIYLLTYLTESFLKNKLLYTKGIITIMYTTNMECQLRVINPPW